MYGGHHDAISDAQRVGDDFATNTNKDRAEFYLLSCSKEKYKTALRDSWENCIFLNSYLVEGYYYELVDGTKDVYYIPPDQPKALLASHLVRSIKIPLEPLHVEPYKFRLSFDVYKNVYNSMPTV
ncbi:hypothetical protein L7F22_027181, partial [Adiantum nelumboides]|nr:hypothetical protein [Adiantum nelumboides]